MSEHYWNGVRNVCNGVMVAAAIFGEPLVVLAMAFVGILLLLTGPSGDTR